MPGAPPRFDATRLLTHPVIVLAVACWWLNDHVLKAALGNTLTGKLSDVAGLSAFPALAVGVAALLGRRPTVRTADGAALLGAVGLAAINTWGAAAEAYRMAFGVAHAALRAMASGFSVPFEIELGALTMDATDLLTLPAALVAPWLARRPWAQGVAREASSS